MNGECGFWGGVSGGSRAYPTIYSLLPTQSLQLNFSRSHSDSKYLRINHVKG